MLACKYTSHPGELGLKNAVGFYTSDIPCHLLTRSACRVKSEGLIPRHSFPTSPQTSPLSSADITLLESYAWPGVPFLPTSGNAPRSRCKGHLNAPK